MYLEGAEALSISNIILGVDLIWLDDVVCIGNESTLASCSHSPFGDIGDCNHEDEVGVRCQALPGEGLEVFYFEIQVSANLTPAVSTVPFPT